MIIEISFKKLGAWWRKDRRQILIIAASIVVIVIGFIIIRLAMERKSEDMTLAIVNGQRIRVSDFRNQMVAVPEFYRAYVAGNRSQFLQDLIDRELVYQKARFSGYARNRDIERRLAELRKDLMVQEYVQKEILENPDIPEKDMSQYYKSHPLDFIQPASVHLYEILVSELKIAQEIEERYQKGESFEDLASKFSEAPSKSKGGDLGFVREGSLPEEGLEKVAFSLSPGEISSPLKTSAGYYLLMVRQNIPSRQLSYEESIPLLKKIMQSKYVEDNFKNFLVELRTKSKIKIMEENLEKMEF